MRSSVCFRQRGLPFTYLPFTHLYISIAYYMGKKGGGGADSIRIAYVLKAQNVIILRSKPSKHNLGKAQSHVPRRVPLYWFVVGILGLYT